MTRAEWKRKRQEAEKKPETRSVKGDRYPILKNVCHPSCKHIVLPEFSTEVNDDGSSKAAAMHQAAIENGDDDEFGVDMPSASGRKEKKKSNYPKELTHEDHMAALLAEEEAAENATSTSKKKKKKNKNNDKAEKKAAAEAASAAKAEAEAAEKAYAKAEAKARQAEAQALAKSKKDLASRQNKSATPAYLTETVQMSSPSTEIKKNIPMVGSAGGFDAEELNVVRGDTAMTSCSFRTDGKLIVTAG